MEPTRTESSGTLNWKPSKDWSQEKWNHIKTGFAHLFCIPYSPYDPNIIYEDNFKETFKQLKKEAKEENNKSFLVLKLQKEIYIEETLNGPRLVANPENSFPDKLHQVVHWIYHQKRLNYEVCMVMDEESQEPEAYIRVYLEPRKRFEKLKSCCIGCSDFTVDQE